MRQTGKKVMESVLVAAGLDRLGYRLRGQRATILAYHNVVPDTAGEDGEAALHLPFRAFTRQLDAICRIGRVLPLEALLGEGMLEEPGGHAFALTFDDAYRGTVTLAVPELERRGLPATLFVAPGLLGDRTFWWDALLSGPNPAAAELRARILAESDGTLAAAERLADELGVRMKRMPEHARSATEDELAAAAGVAGITLGSHTWDHPSLVHLAGERLLEEVARPRAWLRDRFESRYVDVLAYPFGFHSAAVERAAKEAGYRAGLALDPGSVPLRNAARERVPRFRLPRINVPAGLSPRGLRIRSAWT